MKSSQHIIELIDVNKVFDDTYAVENFNLYVRKGEFITFLGPSGCGKTTTLRMIAGFEKPTSGKILLNGKDITNLPPYERNVNTVFQRYALFPHLDVYDNIAFGLKLKKIPCEKTKKDGTVIQTTRKLTNTEIDEKVRKALKMVELEELEFRNISTLSGGQQQRIAIARAIVNEPEILLLDEPLGALDLKMRKEMQLELKEMHRKLGITFIYVTHDQEEALTMSDTIVVMKDGVIKQIGKPEDIYNEPKDAFVANFIGESNIYEGTMVGEKKVRFLNHIFDCDDEFPLHEKVDVVLRPEDIDLCESGQGLVEGRLTSKIFKGVHYEYVLTVGRNEVVIQDTRNLQVNVPASLKITSDDIHIMKKEFTSNIYEAWVDKNNKVIIADVPFDLDITQLVPGSTLTDEGYLSLNSKLYDLTDADVKAEVGLKDMEISDSLEGCQIEGDIVSIIYKGDHYQVIIRTSNGEDFVADTEFAWNENDHVGIKIPNNKIKIILKHEAKNYVKA